MKTRLPPIGDPEIRLLRIFVSVIECGGLAKAQTELNLSLSSISSYISKLEDRFGMRLCHRGRGGFELTEKGKIVYQACTKLFSHHEDFRSCVSDLQEELIGELRLGVIENLVFDATLNLPEKIRRFQEKYDRIWLSIRNLPPSGLEAALLDGNINIGIGQYFRRLPSLSYRTLYTDIQMLHCGRWHPFFDRKDEEISRADLEMAKFADRGYATANHLPQKGVHFHPAATGHNVESILMLVLSGHYISYLPKFYAQPWVRLGEVRPLFPEKLSFEIDIALAVQRDLRPTSLVQTFINELTGNLATSDSYVDSWGD